jgi:hypothetical protein
MPSGNEVRIRSPGQSTELLIDRVCSLNLHVSPEIRDELKEGVTSHQTREIVNAADQ